MSQQQEAEESRMRYALEVLHRVRWHEVTSADLLFLAGELGVTKQFLQDLTQREAA